MENHTAPQLRYRAGSEHFCFCKDMKKNSNNTWYKWEVLALLWVAYLLNQADRQVFNTVLPAIRDALSLTDTSVGLIATVFNLFYAIMVPLGGWAGDRFSRKWVTTVSIIFWKSCNTASCRYAPSFSCS